MFGIDSPELLVIVIVALVVIGPKELPGLLRTWGKWMAQMRGMASEFRGHVDEMVRQSELDEVKKHLESAQGGLDLKSLDPTQQIRSAIQEGMAEGEKAIADAKAALDNPLAEPESAPQVAVEPQPQISTEPQSQIAAEPQSQISAEPQPQISAESAPAEAQTASVEAEPASAEPAAPKTKPVEERPAKAAAE
ncbi:MAG: twin-arginine translocase subunit TatB [Proteobacteria bacterium]|nr:twin-arginine translocase subunit TatB [Pseudomonadota bacterium]